MQLRRDFSSATSPPRLPHPARASETGARSCWNHWSIQLWDGSKIKEVLQLAPPKRAEMQPKELSKTFQNPFLLFFFFLLLAELALPCSRRRMKAAGCQEGPLTVTPSAPPIMYAHANYIVGMARINYTHRVWDTAFWYLKDVFCRNGTFGKLKIADRKSVV